MPKSQASIIGGHVGAYIGLRQIASRVGHAGAPAGLGLLYIRDGIVCALLPLASGIESNPGPGPDPGTPTLQSPATDHLVTPQRRLATTDDQNVTAATRSLNTDAQCIQYNRPSPDDNNTIKCLVCFALIHLDCLKATNYLEGQDWRKQKPLKCIGQFVSIFVSISSSYATPVSPAPTQPNQMT